MKIIVLHGDDTVKSYERLKKFIDVARGRSWEVSYIDESSQSFEEILSESSLFGTQQFFILRDIKKLSKAEYTWFSNKYTELTGNLIIYSDGLLNASILKNLPKDIKVEEFKLPVLIWNFLDNLIPGRSDYLIKAFHKIIDREPPEFIFSLISKHFRDLYWVKADPGSTGFPFWKLNKLKSQASKFNLEQLQSIIKLLSDLDIKVKTSKTDIASELDLLLIKHLE